MIALFVTLVVLVILGGYKLNWNWTGFNGNNKSGKTLWDWLQLLIIPLALASIAILFNRTERKSEQRIASDNQQEAALQGYINEMSELMLERNLRKSDVDAEVRTIARVRTLTVLLRLDKERKRNILQFLHESSLIDKNECIVNLHGANFSRVYLFEVFLHETDLSGITLIEANLGGAYLYRTNLQGANLTRAVLSMSRMNKADLSNAFLSTAINSMNPYSRAFLSGYIKGMAAALSETNLLEANLSHALLTEADLRRTNLTGADLHNAFLVKADLQSAKLSRANLDEAILIEANLHSANLHSARLFEANLRNAYLPKFGPN